LINRRIAGAALVAAFAAVAHAQIPPYYDFALNLRSATGGTGHNSSGVSSISSATPTINAAGTVAVKGFAGTQPGIWIGNPTTSRFVPRPTNFFSDPHINDNGQVVFASSDPSGLYIVQPGAPSATLLTGGPGGATSWSNPRLLESGILGFRSGGAVNALNIYDTNTNSFHTVTQQGTQGISFLFSSAQFNANQRFATKVNTGTSSLEEVRLYNSDGTYATIAQNNAVNAASSFTRFYNNMGFGDNDWIAFNAEMVGGGRRIFVWDGMSTRQFAGPENGLSLTESFDMAIAGDLLYFRAFDNQNRRGIWVADGTTVSNVILEGDVIQTPDGPVRIGSTSGPAFGGSIRVNSIGQVVFAAVLQNPTTGAAMGTGVFTATPVPEPGTVAALALGALALLRRRTRRARR
jgi:hypothetical protein